MQKEGDETSGEANQTKTKLRRLRNDIKNLEKSISEPFKSLIEIINEMEVNNETTARIFDSLHCSVIRLRKTKATTEIIAEYSALLDAASDAASRGCLSKNQISTLGKWIEELDAAKQNCVLFLHFILCLK